MGLQIVQTACDEFWQAYLAQLPTAHVHRQLHQRPNAFGFCEEHPEIVEELAQMVVAGRKRATTSLAIEFSALGEALPMPGKLEIVVGRDGRPVALIELTEVESVPFDDVDAAFAAIEGEGDATLETWRRDHVWYFESVCQRLGGTFNGRTPVLCQTFRAIWPPSSQTL